MARGLEYDDAALKEAFNICQNDPPPQWEMEQMRILEFLGVSNYFYRCKDWQIHHQSPPTVITPPSLTTPTEKREKNEGGQSCCICQ